MKSVKTYFHADPIILLARCIWHKRNCLRKKDNIYCCKTSRRVKWRVEEDFTNALQDAGNLTDKSTVKRI